MNCNTSNEIKEHAAKAFFATAWADLQEEMEESDSMSQLDIMDIMPKTIDSAAIKIANELIETSEQVNDLSIEEMLQKAQKDQSGYRPCNAEYFGHYLAMQAMGTGVGLEEITNEKFKVPYFDFSHYNFENEYPAFVR